jgi:hypothetical protein
MRRLILLIGGLVLVFALAICAPILSARQSAMPGVLLALRLTDCAPPCWIGIVPGVTTIDAAGDRIMAVFGPWSIAETSPTFLWARLNTQPDTGMLNIFLQAQTDSVVDTITFDFQAIYSRDRTTVADLHRVFGAPSRVAVPSPLLTTDFGLVYGSDEQGMMVFCPATDSIAWDQRVDGVMFYTKRQLPVAPSTEVKRWQGFRPLKAYYAAPLAPK